MTIRIGSTQSFTNGRVRRALRPFTVVICLALAAVAALAQTKPAFEVASIKPAVPLDRATLIAAFQNGAAQRLGPRVDGARAEYIYMTVADLIVLAYGVKADQITGPDWITTQPFDIVAKLPDGASKDDVPKMLQSLLEDRFQMALHREGREHPALALLVGEGGLKLEEAAKSLKPIDPSVPLAAGEKQVDGPDGPMRVKNDKNGGVTMDMGEKGALSYVVDPATRSMKIEASQVTMSGFADLLTTLMRVTGGGLPVKDMTGLTGKYPIAITFSLEDLTGAARAKWIDEPAPSSGSTGAAAPASAASDPGGSPSLLKAVQAMGLRLSARRVMVEQLVIDRIEKTPTAN